MTTQKGALEKYARTEEESLQYAEEVALADVAFTVAKLIDDGGMTQRQLAKRMNVSEGRVSQLLSADSNPTVRTMARVGAALGRRFQVDYVAPSSRHRRQPYRGHLRAVNDYEPRDSADEETTAHEAYGYAAH